MDGGPCWSLAGSRAMAKLRQSVTSAPSGATTSACVEDYETGVNAFARPSRTQCTQLTARAAVAGRCLCGSPPVERATRCGRVSCQPVLRRARHAATPS